MTELGPHQNLFAFLGSHYCPPLMVSNETIHKDISYGKLFFLGPWRGLSYALSWPLAQAHQDRWENWVGLSKNSVYFANVDSCLRVRLLGRRAFSLALANLKNSQMAVLSSGVPYRLAINRFSMSVFHQTTSWSYSPVCSRAGIWPSLSWLLEASKAIDVNSRVTVA